MLTYRLTNCEDCTTIPVLLNNIDCKLTELAKKQYGNIVFALNNKINMSVILDLLNYKRILQFKSCNADYASCYSVDQIASKVKLLINK
jgi:ribonuclease HIII